MAHFAKPDDYSDVIVSRMMDNPVDLPVFMRKYGSGNMTDCLHTHDSIQINYVMRGSLCHTVNNNTYDLVKGDIFIIPPYIPHGLVKKKHCDFEIFELEFCPGFVFGTDNTLESFEGLFDFAYIEPFFVSECDIKPRLNLTGKAQIVVEEMLSNLYREYTEQEPSFLLAIRAILLQLLVYVGRRFNENINCEGRELFERHRDAITESIEFINNHFTEDITITDMSRMSMLSQSYFSYLFKCVIGKTFVEYLNELRIREAMDLLTNTNKRVTDVCFEAGFKNVNHFNRTFKKNVGISPMQYRHSDKSTD